MYGRRLTRIDKGAGDFVTAADVEAEKSILSVIHTARPDARVLGEEGGRHSAAEAARQWLVDPLCGTLNYAVGNMLVADNVALRGGAAAVADPLSGEGLARPGRHDYLSVQSVFRVVVIGGHCGGVECCVVSLALVSAGTLRRVPVLEFWGSPGARG
ncbi:hypothetical protein CG719_23935 [Streptomyces sp. CB01373]|nr:hypothetical protein CG719_23935 [Streptomyces sp. CB01373]